MVGSVEAAGFVVGGWLAIEALPVDRRRGELQGGSWLVGWVQCFELQVLGVLVMGDFGTVEGADVRD